MTPAGTADPFWGRGWFWMLLGLASVLPFVVAPLPMMPDLLSHMGRYHVMNHGAESAYLPGYYRFRWELIGNLGVDLLMVPLGAVLPTETAATIAAALIPLLTIAGIHAVARAAWGRIEAPALLALSFVYSFTFLYGFVNYHLSVALALLVFAAWIRLALRGDLVRWLVFAPLALLVWVAHIAGWAVLLLLIGCWEASPVLRPRVTNRLAGLASAAWRTLPVALPMLVTLLWRSSHAATHHDYVPLKKAAWLAWLLRAESPVLDLAALAVLAFLALWLHGHAQSRRNNRLLLAAAALFACFLILPQWLFESNYADARLLPVAAIILFLGFGAPTAGSGNIIALVGLALFGARLAATTIGWHQRGTAAVADLAVLDHVPRGARIAVLRSESICSPWALSGLDHLASLAIIRKEAFVNTEWDTAGAQLMRPIYNDGRAYNSSGSGLVNSQSEACGYPLAVVLAEIPRDRFDFVWTIGSKVDVPWLNPVATGPDGHLYRIVAPRPASIVPAGG